MRYRLVRLAALLALPYWYSRIFFARKKMLPSDYFLLVLSSKKRRCTQVILFIFLLSIAARSFDAVIALRALKGIGTPIPLWALSARDIRLLLEASLWLGQEHEFDAIANEILRRSSPLSRVRRMLSFYQSFARNEADAVDFSIGQPVLLALFLERSAAKSLMDGRVSDSAKALYQALKFVPGDDPRRAELVARFRRIEASLHEGCEE